MEEIHRDGGTIQAEGEEACLPRVTTDPIVSVSLLLRTRPALQSPSVAAMTVKTAVATKGAAARLPCVPQRRGHK
ncbi:unnamed protein product [Arctogadus glacialis]